MRKIRLVLEYDGTHYHGWQRQPGKRTVQQTLEEAIQRMTAEETRVVASSRTDRGVHALGQSVHFTTERTIPLRAFQQGLNTLLPRDVVVREIEEVPLHFDARRDVEKKRYRYRIDNAPVRSALLRHYTWHIREPLDIEAMNRASESMIGERDFSSFRSSGCASRDAVRRVLVAEWGRHGSEVGFEIEANAFLRYMVRKLVGSLVKVGLGSWSLDDFKEVLEAKDSRRSAPTAPPHGLYLVSVSYREMLPVGESDRGAV